MTDNDPEPDFKQLTSWLVACDEALAARRWRATPTFLPGCEPGCRRAWPA
jgi:hypothetical protein